MTIKQLITKLDNEYSSIMEDIRKSEYDIYELCQGTDFIEKIVENINLTVTDKEYRIMTNEIYGIYNYVTSKEKLVENLKVDFFEWKVVDPEKFKTITQFKKYILSECQSLTVYIVEENSTKLYKKVVEKNV